MPDKIPEQPEAVTPLLLESSEAQISALHNLGRVFAYSRLSFLLERLRGLSGIISPDRDDPQNLRFIDEASAHCQELREIDVEKVCEMLEVPFDSDFSLDLQFVMHEANNAIGAIMSILDMLKDGSPKSRRFCEILKTNADAVYLAGQMARHCFYPEQQMTDPYSTKELCLSIGKIIGRLFFENEHFKITLDLNALDCIKLDVNLVRVFAVFRNLVTNACDAGANNVLIALRLDKAHPDYIKLEVSNDGDPIPETGENGERVIERVFDAGYTNGDGKKYGGKGIGLNGARKKLEETGGFFGEVEKQVSADEGGLGGARFNVYLPISEVSG
jgi:signal transduction histidine kinase